MDSFSGAVHSESMVEPRNREELRSRKLTRFLQDPTPRNARHLDMSQLAVARQQRTIDADEHAAVVAVLTSEEHRKLAWQGPARWSLAVSVLAFIVAVAALAFSMLGWR